MYSRGRFFRFIKSIIDTLSHLEKRIWTSFLFIFAVILILQALSTTIPGLLDWSHKAIETSSTFYNKIGYIQAGLLTLIVSIPTIKYFLTKSPVEPLARKFHKLSYPHLFRDLEFLTSLNQVRFDASNLQFVSTDKDVEEFSKMNSESFKDSDHYSGSINEKLFRNRNLHQKYNQCFAFSHGPNGVRIGFSCVLALNDDAADLYLNGQLSDKNIRGIHLQKKGLRSHCILLFAIGLVPECEAKRGKHTKYFIRQLIRCHALHAKRIVDDFDARGAHLIVQVEKSSIVKLLKACGFKKISKKGADGDELYATSWNELSRYNW